MSKGSHAAVNELRIKQEPAGKKLYLKLNFITFVDQSKCKLTTTFLKNFRCQPPNVLPIQPVPLVCWAIPTAHAHQQSTDASKTHSFTCRLQAQLSVHVHGACPTILWWVIFSASGPHGPSKHSTLSRTYAINCSPAKCSAWWGDMYPACQLFT